jgi:outer membrane protein OmpA-like peptidoglycan-associated protein
MAWVRRIAWGGGVALLVSGAAWSDVPRLDLSVGVWQHDNQGTLSSNDPLIAVPPGFELTSDPDPYARFGVRLGNTWWAPVVRARYTGLAAEGSSFRDDSTFLGMVLLNLDTTSTRTQVDFEHLEGLMYFTIGSKIRGELGGGVKKFDGLVETVQVRNTSLNGEVVSRAQRELPSDLRVFYGAAYAEPASWLSFGGEAVRGTESGLSALDLTFRFIIKPFTWMGVEGGYRRLTLKADNVDNTSYDFEFGGPYAALSFLYGSKDAGLMQPDTDEDGVNDKNDQCPESREGAVVSESGCEPDGDGDNVPDALDQCLETPEGAEVDDKGCHRDGDNDGSPDGLDQCPETPAGTRVDASGCPETGDVDVDGVADDKDQCADTPAGAPVDADGCLQGDKDQDGVADEQDQCPGGAAGSVYANGCPMGAAAETPPEVVAPAKAGPDADQDGVIDADDRCPKTPRGFKVDATGCLVQQESVLQGITFAKNSSYLMRDSEVLLLEAVEALKADRTRKIVIQGHTCDIGEAKYNKWLSQRRANRVLEFLVRHGIDASRLLAVGYGEEQPLVPNDDERMRELNRRTVFKVVE